MKIEKLNEYIKVLTTADIVGKYLVSKGGKDIRCDIEEDSNDMAIVHIYDNTSSNGKDIISVYEVDGVPVIFDEHNMAVISMEDLRDKFNLDLTLY